MKIPENKIAKLKKEYANTGLPAKIHIINSLYREEESDGLFHQVHYYEYEEIKDPREMKADCVKQAYDI